MKENAETTPTSELDTSKSAIEKSPDKVLANSQNEAESQSPSYSAYTPDRKRVILTIVTVAGFFGPLCGAVYLPSLVLYKDIFDASAEAINATVSVYMATFAIVPLFGAAASDYGGRKTVYIVGLASFLIANILLAALPAHIGALFVLRIFQAIGSCIVFSVGAGTVADITEPKDRAAALSWFLLGPQLGPILGPLIGGQFAHISRWRWAFGFLALAAFPLFVAILFCLPETLRSLVGNGQALTNKPWFFLPSFRQKPVSDIDGKKIAKTPRPTFKGLYTVMTYPPHLIVGINGALQFAGLYAIFITFPKAWEEEFNFTFQEVGYVYLVPGVALLIGSITTGRISDFMRAKMVQGSPDGKVAPERRIPIQIGALIISAIGKTMYGWFTEYRIHPAAGLSGSALAAVGTAIIFVTSSSFQTEIDPSQAATVVASGGLLRNIAAAICAVIMNSLIERMGWNWCFTGLAALDIICIPGIILIMLKGAQFRKQLTNRMNT